MKDFRLFPRRVSAVLPVAALSACLTGVLAAHPGHYHPDETDEFDFFRAFFFHSHGVYDYLLAGVALASVVTAFVSKRPAVRIGALVTGAASLALLPIL